MPAGGCVGENSGYSRQDERSIIKYEKQQIDLKNTTIYLNFIDSGEMNDVSRTKDGYYEI